MGQSCLLKSTMFSHWWLLFISTLEGSGCSKYQHTETSDIVIHWLYGACGSPVKASEFLKKHVRKIGIFVILITDISQNIPPYIIVFFQKILQSACFALFLCNPFIAIISYNEIFIALDYCYKWIRLYCIVMIVLIFWFKMAHILSVQVWCPNMRFQ